MLGRLITAGLGMISIVACAQPKPPLPAIVQVYVPAHYDSVSVHRNQVDQDLCTWIYYNSWGISCHVQNASDSTISVTTTAEDGSTSRILLSSSGIELSKRSFNQRGCEVGERIARESNGDLVLQVHYFDFMCDVYGPEAMKVTADGEMYKNTDGVWKYYRAGKLQRVEVITEGKVWYERTLP